MKLNYAIVALLLPGVIWAQTSDTNKEVEQIVITKKGSGAEKLNIVVDGETVTVNGKPVNKEDKNSTITIIRRKIKDADVLIVDGEPGDRRIIRRSIDTRAPQPPSPPNKAMLGVTTSRTEQGVTIMSVAEGSAAEIAGLKEGDILKEVDRNKIETPDDLSNAIKDKSAGDKVTLVYVRDNKQNTAVAELKKWEPQDIAVFRNLDFNTVPGFDVEELRSRLGDINNQNGNIQLRAFGVPMNRVKLGLKIQDVETGSGVKVIGVEEDSDAAKAGVKQGDIIKEVDGKIVNSSDDMRAKVLNAKPGDAMQMKLDRNGRSQNVKIQFSKKIKTADL